MTKATIFGKGNMGTAVAGIFTAGGATVEQLDSSGGTEPFSSCFFELKNEHGSGDLSSPLRAAPQPT